MSTRYHNHQSINQSVNRCFNVYWYIDQAFLWYCSIIYVQILLLSWSGNIKSPQNFNGYWTCSVWFYLDALFTVSKVFIWRLVTSCSKPSIPILNGLDMTWMCGENDAILAVRSLQYWMQMVSIYFYFVSEKHEMMVSTSWSQHWTSDSSLRCFLLFMNLNMIWVSRFWYILVYIEHLTNQPTF